MITVSRRMFLNLIVFSNFYIISKKIKLGYNHQPARNENDLETIDDSELCLKKRKRLLDKEFWEIVNEILSFSMFLIFLFVVAYSNVSESSYNFNQLYLKNSDYLIVVHCLPHFYILFAFEEQILI